MTRKKTAQKSKTAKATTAKKPGVSTEKRNLFRVIFRGCEYMGTAEQFHAKVVAPDFATALSRACMALGLDPSRLEGAIVTTIQEDTEMVDGKVFDFARRSRGYGERGGWIYKDVLPLKIPSGPRKTPLL